MLSARGRRYLRFVLPIAAIWIAAALVVIFVVLPILAPTPVPPSKCCIFGTPLALGQPTEESAGLQHWYNFSVESAGGGIDLGNIQFQVVTATGSNVPPTNAWSLSVLSLADAPVGAYSWAAVNWTTGGGAALSSDQIVVLDSGATNLSDKGDVLDVIGAGSFQGSISVEIP